MEKLVIGNIYSPQNAGDRAIVDNMIYFSTEMLGVKNITLQSKYWYELKNRFINDCIREPIDLPPNKGVILSSAIAVLSLLKNLLSLSIYLSTPKKFKRRIVVSAEVRPLIGSSMVFVAGGNYLFSSNRSFLSRTMLVHLGNILFYTIASKKVVVFPQTIGPFYRSYEVKLVGIVLKRCSIVCLRDKRSYQFLSDLGLSNLLLCPDIAFLNSMIESKVFRRPKHALFTLMEWEWSVPPALPFSYNQYKEEYLRVMREAILFLKSQGMHVTVGCHVSSRTHSDKDLCLNFSESLNVAFADLGAMPTSEVYKLYSNQDIVVGTRMHSCILGIANGKPTIGIGYQPKCLGTFNLLGLDNYIFDIYNLKTSSIIEIITKILENYHEENLKFLNLSHEIQSKFVSLAHSVKAAPQ
jgi:colanic acid/amylovoran biosynthesis protein